MRKIRAIDLFCGAGGSSCGATQAGVDVVAGFDMWPPAGAVYAESFPGANFYGGRLEDHDPEALASKLGRVDLILASPECTNHSPAKGNKPRCEKSKATAMQVVRFAKAFAPRWIVVENVVNMRRWSRYPEFIEALQGLGYKTAEQVLNAADFGVPQSRRRLFIVCDRRQQPAPIRIPQKRHASAATIIDFNGTYQFSPLRTDRRAKATLARADRAIETLGPDVPFLIVYYGSDQAGGWQGLDRPLRTITTLDRFALVKPSKTGHAMRMLQPAELQKAMGFPCAHTMMHGTRRDRIRMMGNAVCPPVMAAAVKAVIEDV